MKPGIWNFRCTSAEVPAVIRSPAASGMLRVICVPLMPLLLTKYKYRTIAEKPVNSMNDNLPPWKSRNSREHNQINAINRKREVCSNSIHYHFSICTGTFTLCST